MAYFFQLPLITELTVAQQAALKDTGPIAITGGPGTGKSVVALWRHIRNYGTEGNRSILLTYTKTLEHYLTLACKQENEAASMHVSRTYYWTTHHAEPYDEIIVDEAQDVEVEKYEKIKKYSNLVSYGADDRQNVYPNNGMNQVVLQGLFPHNREYLLDENFRNTYEIMSFIKWVFPRKRINQIDLNNLRAKGRIGPLPTYFFCNSQQDRELKAIQRVIQEFASSTHNIAVLIPFKDNAIAYHQLLSSVGIDASIYYNGYPGKVKMKNIHVTTFKSAKGVEFDTVIIPNFDQRTWLIRKNDVVSENDYFVALSRAKRNLFLLGHGPLIGVKDEIVKQEAVL